MPMEHQIIYGQDRYSLTTHFDIVFTETADKNKLCNFKTDISSVWIESKRLKICSWKFYFLCLFRYTDIGFGKR